MDLKIIEQKQLVERYLVGRLSPPEAKFFEKLVRESPDLAERMGLPETLKRTMRLLDETGTEWREQTPRIWHQWWFVAAIGAVAILGLLLAIGQWSGKRTALERLDKLQGEAYRGVLLPPTRTVAMPLAVARPNEAPKTYPIGNRAQPTLADLALDVSFVNDDLYRVTIKRDDGTLWARFDNQIRDSNKTLRLGLNSAAFSAGTYEITIEGLDRHGGSFPAGHLRLRVDSL